MGGVAFADRELAQELQSVAVALVPLVGPFRLAVGVDVPAGARTASAVRDDVAPLVRKAVTSIENGLRAVA
jgi:DNA-binding IclR family transcriptional regulator